MSNSRPTLQIITPVKIQKINQLFNTKFYILKNVLSGKYLASNYLNNTQCRVKSSLRNHRILYLDRCIWINDIRDDRILYIPHTLFTSILDTVYVLTGADLWDFRKLSIDNKLEIIFIPVPTEEALRHSGYDINHMKQLRETYGNSMHKHSD